MNSLQTRWIGVGVLALTLVVGSLMPVFAQERDRERQRDRGERRQVDREQMRERMQQRQQQRQERLREQLGMSQEEFDAVHPMIETVQGYQRDQWLAGAERRAGRGMRGRGAGGELSDEGQALHDATRQLREAIESESISQEELDEQLNALRESRNQLAGALDNARAKLREVLTPRQEAVLVLRGVLD